MSKGIIYVATTAVSGLIKTKNLIKSQPHAGKTPGLVFIKRMKNGAFRGATYWQFNGTKLKDLPDITES